MRQRIEPKIIYLAGIIDGEGHISLVNLRNGRGVVYPIARIVVNQKDTRLTAWLKANFGGSVYDYPVRGKYPAISRWELRGTKAITLAKQIQPYLIVKQEQVLTIL